jgi:hypothetical protein
MDTDVRLEFNGVYRSINELAVKAGAQEQINKHQAEWMEHQAEAIAELTAAVKTLTAALEQSRGIFWLLRVISAAVGAVVGYIAAWILHKT